ncbi:MAG: hypothetical protein Ta2A_02330 [Treponemataceae bacterium]|nr:MAG: hypothetical protein Ta2A_02330 [Treponemataceae bacterium]
MSKGLVYMVKNPAFPHLFKIGRTTKKVIEERGLNASNVPEDFETLKAIEVDESEAVEHQLHIGFDQYRHESITGRKTEFFYIGCLDHAMRTLEGTKGAIDMTEEVSVLVQEESEKADEKEVNVDPAVNDWVSWDDLRLLRDPSDKFITEPNAKRGWMKAVNFQRMSIVPQAKKLGKWNDKKLSKQWLIGSGWMDNLMKIQWAD